MDYWRYAAKWGVFTAVICGWAAFSLRCAPDGAGTCALTVVAVANLANLIGLCLNGLFGRPPDPVAVGLWARYRTCMFLRAGGRRLLAALDAEPCGLHCFLWRESPSARAAVRGIDAAIRARSAGDDPH